MSLEKEFVQYPEALELKQLGFDEPCLGARAEHGFMTPNDVSTLQDDITIEDIENTQDENMCLSPLYQQAFRFFREYPDWPIESWIQPYLSNELRQHEAFYWRRGEKVSVGVFSTYDEAQLNLLRKLIEIVKTKQ